MGVNSHKLSQQANVELRSQRDQIVNVVNLMKDIGFDLLRADKLAQDINYRRLLNIVMLYLIIFLLFASIGLTLWFKIRHHGQPTHHHRLGWLKSHIWGTH
mmetsp:Transcript_42220/g.64728  ORF Transcript_42220/g.64728 Transcript_42220/m.64728 type:complete len:101 (+) Transcript_42220:522-824(+)